MITGRTNVIYPRIQSATLRPLPVFASSLNFFQLQPYLVTQNKTKHNEPSGNKTLLTIKSSKSIIDEPAPNGVIPERTLNPKIQGRTRTSIRMQFIKLAFFLDHLNKSIVDAKMFSKTARTVENAANVKNIKNKLPQNLPREYY